MVFEESSVVFEEPWMILQDSYMVLADSYMVFREKTVIFGHFWSFFADFHCRTGVCLHEQLISLSIVHFCVPVRTGGAQPLFACNFGADRVQ